KIAVIVQRLHTESLHTSIVRIADEGSCAIRLRVRLDVLEHPLQPRPRAIGNGLAGLAQQEIGRGERLDDEPVVRGRLLEVDAVLRCLPLDFVDDDAGAEAEPAPASSGVAEEHAEEHKADGVAQIVVAVDLSALEMRDDVLAVQEERPEKPTAEARGTARGG